MVLIAENEHGREKRKHKDFSIKDCLLAIEADMNYLIQKTRRETKKEILDKLHLARQCLNFKGFTCENKNCLNTYCPLNVNFEKLKQEAK